MGEGKEHVRRFSLDALKATMGGGKKHKKNKKKGPPSARQATARGDKLPHFDLTSYDISKPDKSAPTDSFLTRDYNVEEIKSMEVTAANAARAWEMVRALNKDCRLILAYNLLAKLEAFLQAPGGSEAVKAPIKAELEGAYAKEMGKLKDRGVQCIEVVKGSSAAQAAAATAAGEAPPTASPGGHEKGGKKGKEKGEKGGVDEWIFAQSLFGMDTYYKYAEGKLYCKVQGKFEKTNIFDQLAVIREADLYNKWGPFVSKSTLIKRFPIGEMALHFTLNMPLLQRDVVAQGFCCDCYETNQLIFFADSVEEIEGATVPPKPSGWTTDRMEINKFRCLITATGPTSGEVVLSAILDPKTNLPTNLVNFAVKQLVGVLVYLLQEAARKVPHDPSKNPHARKMRDEAFYREWLLPRARFYNAQRGWPMPKLSAFEGFSPSTPALTPDSHGGPSSSASAGASPATPKTQQVTSVQSADAATTKKPKKQKPKFWWSKKKDEPKSAPEPQGLIAQAVALLTPKKVPTPGKSTRTMRTPHSSRQSPFRRTNNPAGFAIVVGAFFLLQASRLPSFLRGYTGYFGEMAFLTLLLQGVLMLSSAYGFFDANYTAKIFDDKNTLSLTGASGLTAVLSVLGGVSSASMAFLRTHKIQFVPREGLPVDAWSTSASSGAHYWNAALVVVLVILITRPESVRKWVRSL